VASAHGSLHHAVGRFQSEEDVRASVAGAVRAVVGSDVDPEASLMESGLDSLGSVVRLLAGTPCIWLI
jgi:hypothetical protein